MNSESYDLQSYIDALPRCFAKLSHDDQVVLAMHYFCGQSAAQIATTLHTTRGAILARLHRARQRLRELLEECKPCLAA